MKRSPKRVLIGALIVILILAAGVLYFVLDPGNPNAGIFFPKCPFRLIFKIPCAGCGSQRALHALLHLDFSEAMRMNALLVIMIPILLVMGISSLFRTSHPKFYLITHNHILIYALFAIILAWWVLRIIFGWYV